MVEYVKWYLKAVETDMEDVKAGRTVSHEELKRDWENKLAQLMN